MVREEYALEAKARVGIFQRWLLKQNSSFALKIASHDTKLKKAQAVYGSWRQSTVSE